MSERYKRLFALAGESYAEGAPVSIAAGALLLDNESGTVLAQIKYRSLSAKPIKALTVEICPRDVAGAELEKVSHRYLDLDVKRGEEFAQKLPVTMPDSGTRAFTAAVTEAVFADGIVWHADTSPWETMPEPVPFAEELLDQYRIECGEGCEYAYSEHKDLWFCACGEVNKRTDDVCIKCGKSAEKLKAVNIEELKEHKEARLAEEARIAEEKRIEAERIAEEKRIASELARKKLKKTSAIVAVAAALCVAAALLITKVIIPNGNYGKAVALRDAGEYDAAIEAFEALDGYKDSKEQIKPIKYAKAVALRDTGEYDAAIEAFEELGNYKDCKEQIEPIKYAKAIALRDAGNYKAAMAAFEAISEYKDSKYQAEVLQFKLARVGGIVYFGTYEQDNIASNGKEIIEWKVIDRKDGKVLLLSKHGLDCKPFNTEYTDVTWETCTLRTWLNDEFINAAFTETERGMILTSKVTADKNPQYNTNQGNDTKDKIFLLSLVEAKKYLTSKSALEGTPTKYAKAQGAWVPKDDNPRGTVNCSWWLRSSGSSNGSGTAVSFACIIDNSSGGVHITSYAVRPAMWVNIES